MSADLKAAMQADYEQWKARKAVMGGDGLLLSIWNDAYEAAWNSRAPLPAEQPSNPVQFDDDTAEVLGEFVATEVVHYIDSMYPEMWKPVAKSARTSIRNVIIAQTVRVMARIVGQQTNSEGK